MMTSEITKERPRLGTLESQMYGDIIHFDANEYAEPGYNSDKPIVFGNWNGNYGTRLANVLERSGFELEWSDEWVTCSDCGKAVRTQPDSYSWMQSYHLLGGYDTICHECIRADPEEYFEDLIDNDNVADTFHLDLSEFGFTQIPMDTYYENGFHPGQTDDPKELGPRLVPPGHERVWQIIGVGQFDVRFALFVRPQD